MQARKSALGMARLSCKAAELFFPTNGDRVGLADGEWSPVPHNALVGGQTYDINSGNVDVAGPTAATIYVLLQKQDAYCA